MATSTPWGPSQNATKYGKGITMYGTAGHGGFKLSTKLNEKVNPAFRDPSKPFGQNRAKGWYEEDCDAFIVIVTFPERFPAGWVTLAHNTVKRYHPATYSAVFPNQ